VLGQLSWYHQIALLDKLKLAAEREWYARAAIVHGWSRNVLVHQIETRLHERQGAAITNFKQTLPIPQSELAQQLVKDPYILDFVTLAQDAIERDLEAGLTDHLKQFLLELGKGFAFMGRQYPLQVGGQDFFLDLLFYNTRLHCHVVIDLKMDDFKPEYAGKMQFYLAAVDEHLKSDRDDPSIGLILCKTKNGVVVEYALRDSARPIGVAEYRVLPARLAESLPTAEQLENELARVEAQAAPSPADGEAHARGGLPL
jgi:predicted nuclease of restriction endonuclease-like (RecB) superfamily